MVTLMEEYQQTHSKTGCMDVNKIQLLEAMNLKFHSQYINQQMHLIKCIS